MKNIRIQSIPKKISDLSCTKLTKYILKNLISKMWHRSGNQRFPTYTANRFELITIRIAPKDEPNLDRYFNIVTDI